MSSLLLQVTNYLLALVGAAAWTDLVRRAKLVTLWAFDQLEWGEVEVTSSLALSGFRRTAFWQWWHGMVSLRYFVIGREQGSQDGKTLVELSGDAMARRHVAICATLWT